MVSSRSTDRRWSFASADTERIERRQSSILTKRARRALAITAVVCASLQVVAWMAHAAGVNRQVKITTSGTVRLPGHVVRADRDTYTLQTVGGKSADVSIESDENNAVFEILDQNGKVLPCAGGGDCVQWSDELPLNGTYRIVVGGTRGNANYTLVISIR